MAGSFLAFSRKFWGRYVRLTRLDVVGRQLIRREVVIGALIVMLGVSFWPQSPIQRAILNVGGKPDDPKAHLGLAKEAAKIYDYKLAEEEYKRAQEISTQVLGARKEIFPEEVLREEIGKLKKLAEEVEARDVYLQLAVLYWRLFDEEKAREYWQKAWWIDPNNETVREVEGLFSR
ncbi:MAG: hypothetical protein HY381_00175 [Candidatus Chisholmbacteria bacterium]|nr:hypothetical protein [Candidatus Chisholmbacteria bacterium]